MYDYGTFDEERKALRAGILLAKTRYNAKLAKFVKNSAERLAYVTDEIQEIACQCAAETGADPQAVEAAFRAILADQVAVTEPERQSVTDGEESLPPAKNIDHVPDPEHPFATTDIEDTDAVLVDELMEPDARIQLTNTKEADLYGPLNNMLPGQPTEAGPGVVNQALQQQQRCPSCGQPVGLDGKCQKCGYDRAADMGTMTPTPQYPAQEAQPAPTYACFRCEAALNIVVAAAGAIVCSSCEEEILKVAAPPPQQPTPIGTEQAPPTPDGQPLPPSPDGGDNPDAPVDTAQPGDEDEHVKKDDHPHNPAEMFNSIVGDMANIDGAMTWSTPGDRDITDIAQQYSLRDDEVRQNLKIIADFGGFTSVNGDPNVQEDTPGDGFTELTNFGGRVPTYQAEVDVDSAVHKTAEETGLAPDQVYQQINEYYGDDIGGQYYMSVTGDARYYLPTQLVGQGGRDHLKGQPAGPSDQQNPSETAPDEDSQYTSKLKFASFADFSAWNSDEVDRLLLRS